MICLVGFTLNIVQAFETTYVQLIAFYVSTTSQSTSNRSRSLATLYPCNTSRAVTTLMLLTLQQFILRELQIVLLLTLLSSLNGSSMLFTSYGRDTSYQWSEAT